CLHASALGYTEPCTRTTWSTCLLTFSTRLSTLGCACHDSGLQITRVPSAECPGPRWLHDCLSAPDRGSACAMDFTRRSCRAESCCQAAISFTRPLDGHG